MSGLRLPKQAQAQLVASITAEIAPMLKERRASQNLAALTQALNLPATWAGSLSHIISDSGAGNVSLERLLRIREALGLEPLELVVRVSKRPRQRKPSDRAWRPVLPDAWRQQVNNTTVKKLVADYLATHANEE